MRVGVLAGSVLPSFALAKEPFSASALQRSSAQGSSVCNRAASNLKQDVALYTGSRGAARIARMDDHPPAPASLVDHRGSSPPSPLPSPPNKC
jgi:hypothetical protein